MSDDEGKIVVERMTNLGEWELYRLADEESDEVVCKVGLRAGGDVEYGIWRKEEAEPSATGTLQRDGAAGWGDEAREQVLRKLAGIYEEGMPEVERGLVFRIGDVEEDAEDDGDEDDSDKDEDDGEEES